MFACICLRLFVLCVGARARGAAAGRMGVCVGVLTGGCGCEIRKRGWSGRPTRWRMGGCVYVYVYLYVYLYVYVYVYVRVYVYVYVYAYAAVVL